MIDVISRTCICKCGTEYDSEVLLETMVDGTRVLRAANPCPNCGHDDRVDKATKTVKTR